jgi:metal-sulfur cluster biosynthetic enzyme
VSGSVDIELVWQALRTCYDPEIPVNIVDLGLIYDCCIIENKVIVSMTLTAPLCGMGPVLMSDVQNTLLEVANVTDVKVEMVFDPPWTTERMSESAKIELGLI